MAKKSKRPPVKRGGPPSIVILAALVIVTLAVFAQVTSHEFLNYDDGQFVTENEHVMHGVTRSSLTWAFTSASIGWYPLTWIAHMIDVDVWGLRAGMHLMTGVVLHILSACILFLALRRMTDAPWPSAIVAALFAIHPMHVESVAWVSERKDTLSTLFAMLALLAYAASRKRWLVFALMALSLMAKQMYVTLPFVLLLLDYWPLDRLHTLAELRVRVAEKVELFALSIGGAVMAVIGQQNLGSVQRLGVAERLGNSSVAYFRYAGKLFMPIDLAVLYPLHPIATSIAVVAAIALVAISIVVFRFRGKAPHVFAGWFWFAGTLVPVIGVVQIGPQSIADRYSYFPFVGLFIAIVWSIPRSVVAIAGTVVVIVLAVIAHRQVAYWQNSEMLFTHTLAVTNANPLAEYLLGQSLELRDPDTAIDHLRRAIALGEPAHLRRQWMAQSYVGLGTAMLAKARTMPASPEKDAQVRNGIAQLQYALVLDPNVPHAKNNLAFAAQLLSGRG